MEIGDTIELGGQAGIIRDFMTREGMPEWAVVEWLEPQPDGNQWSCIDTTKFRATKIEPN